MNPNSEWSVSRAIHQYGRVLSRQAKPSAVSNDGSGSGEINRLDRHDWMK